MLKPNRPTVRKLARKVNILAMGQERKFYDTGFNATSITSNADWSSSEFDPSTTSMVSTPPVGDDASSRDGKKIAVYSIAVRGAITWNPQADQTAGETRPGVRVSLVLDKQTNGAQLNSEDVYSTVSTGVNAIIQPLRDQNFRKRFRILRTKVFTPPLIPMTWDGTNIETDGSFRLFSFFVRFRKPLIINFNSGTTASVANVLDNSIHVLANASTTGSTLAYNAQLIFVG